MRRPRERGSAAVRRARLRRLGLEPLARLDETQAQPALRGPERHPGRHRDLARGHARRRSSARAPRAERAGARARRSAPGARPRVAGPRRRAGRPARTPKSCSCCRRWAAASRAPRVRNRSSARLRAIIATYVRSEPRRASNLAGSRQSEKNTSWTTSSAAAASPSTRTAAAKAGLACSRNAPANPAGVLRSPCADAAAMGRLVLGATDSTHSVQEISTRRYRSTREKHSSRPATPSPSSTALR